MAAGLTELCSKILTSAKYGSLLGTLRTPSTLKLLVSIECSTKRTIKDGLAR